MSILDRVRAGLRDETCGSSNFSASQVTDFAYRFGRDLAGSSRSSRRGSEASGGHESAESETDQAAFVSSDEGEPVSEAERRLWAQVREFYVEGILEAICREVWGCPLSEAPTILNSLYDPHIFGVSKDRRVLGGFMIFTPDQPWTLGALHIDAVDEPEHELNLQIRDIYRQDGDPDSIVAIFRANRRGGEIVRAWLKRLPPEVLEMAK